MYLASRSACTLRRLLPCLELAVAGNQSAEVRTWPAVRLDGTRLSSSLCQCWEGQEDSARSK